MSESEWEHGTWPENFRDIDPSLLVAKTHHDGWSVNQINWWTPHNYDTWTSASTPVEWLKNSSDLPPPLDFLQIKSATDGKEWTVLDAHYHWRRKNHIGDFNGKEPDTQELHYIIRSYLTKRQHLSEILKWGHNQDWINDRLPSADEYWHVHLCERYWSPHFNWPLDEDWIKELHSGGDALPHPLLQTTADLSCERSTFDCSIEDNFSISMPSRWLAEKMRLHVDGRYGDFVDPNGSVVAFDPSTRDAGHSTLLMNRKALQDFLESEDLALVWTLLGEKNIYPPESEESWLGRLTILGIYGWTGEKIEGGFRTEFTGGHY